MPLDPRIALQGIQWEAPDILGAVRQGQDIRKNNMAMAREVAADEALFNFFNPPPGARPMNLSAADQGALGGFRDTFASMPAGVGRGPPITVSALPSVGAPPASRMASRAAAAVASAVAPPPPPAPPMSNAMRAAPAADVRSAMMARMAPAGAQPDISTLIPFAYDPRVKAILDQRAAQDERKVEADKVKKEEEQQAFVRTVAGVLANPDDAGLAAAAQQYPQFAPDIERIAQLPLDQRSAALTSLMATLPGGEDFVKLFAPKPVQIDVGGMVYTVDMNPNSPTYLKELRKDAKTADPNRPQTMQFITDARGNVIGINRETGHPTDTGVDAPAPGGAAGAGPDPDLARGRAIRVMRDGAGVLLSELKVLRDRRFLRGEGDTPLEGAAQFARDVIPGARGLALAMDPRAEQANDRIRGTVSTLVGQLKDLYGTSSRAMDAVRELELALAQFGAEGSNYEAGVALVDDLVRRVDEMDRYYREDMGAAEGTQGGGQGPSQRRLSPREAAGLAPGTEFIGLDGSLMVRQ
jgi:hypothetical protein